MGSCWISIRIISVRLLRSEFKRAMSVWDVALTGGVDDHGLVKLNWSSTYIGAEEHVYEVWRCPQGECSDNSWKRLSTFAIEEDEVRVLNVYPVTGAVANYFVDFKFANGEKARIHKSAALKVWMEGGTMVDGSTTVFDGAGRTNNEAFISVDTIDALSFESRPGIMWDYDVVMFGTWDYNGRNMSCYEDSNYREFNLPRPRTVEQVARYIDEGFGVLAGHDTINGHENADIGLCQIRNRFGIMAVDYKASGACPNLDSEGVGTCYYIGTSVKLVKRGLITDFPWSISGDVSYTIPESHTWNNIAEGDVWFEFVNGYFDEASTAKCKSYEENGRYFLTTYRNTAMIQSGHSDGNTAEIERKLMANTICYLKQRTSRNWSYDRSVTDDSSPGAPTCRVGYGENIEFSCSASDELQQYWYKVVAHGKTDYSKSVESNILKSVKGRIKSFTYWGDGVDGRHTLVATNNRVIFHLDNNAIETGVINIYATDSSGNDSPVTRISFAYVATDTWNRYSHKSHMAFVIFPSMYLT